MGTHLDTPHEFALRWMPQDLTIEKSTLVMAWCVRQQAITQANVDPELCRHMASLGHNGLAASEQFPLTFN